MSKKGIIFDMDGTLWDSAEGVAKSWDEKTKELYPDAPTITEKDIQGVMGLTMDKLADKIFPWLEEEARYDLLDICGSYENDYLRKHGGVLYPNLEEVLQELQENYNLYIVSNCQSGYIEAFLEYYGFGKYFKDIECYGNNKLSKGENIRNIVERNRLDKAVYVGDIQGDYDSTMEAGIDFIHAAYGFGTINTPVPKINSLKELKEAAFSILGE